MHDSMAQWIRRWSTEPEILGSIPSGVVFLSLFFIFFGQCGPKNKYCWFTADPKNDMFFLGKKTTKKKPHGVKNETKHEKGMEMRGIDPRTSRMLSERSTI